MDSIPAFNGTTQQLMATCAGEWAQRYIIFNTETHPTKLMKPSSSSALPRDNNPRRFPTTLVLEVRLQTRSRRVASESCGYTRWKGEPVVCCKRLILLNCEDNRTSRSVHVQIWHWCRLIVDVQTLTEKEREWNTSQISICISGRRRAVVSKTHRFSN